MTVEQGTLVTLGILVLGLIVHAKFNRWAGIGIIYIAGLVGSAGAVSTVLSNGVVAFFGWLQSLAA